MAVNTINSNQLIPGAYVTLIQKDSYPDGNANEQSSVTLAVYSSVTLMQQGVIGIIGDISSSWTSLSALMSSTLQIPQCSFASKTIALSDKTQYKYFFRSIPTQVIFADVMLSFAALQGWSKIGIIYSDSTLGQQFFQRAIIQAGNQGLEIVESHSFDPAIDIDDMTYALQNVTQGRTRVIIVAATDTTQTSLMVHAASMGYMTNDYTWLLLGVSDTLLQQSVQQYNQNHTTLPPLDYNTTFNGLFMFDDWLSLKGYGPFDSFLQQWSSLNPQTYPKAGTPDISTNEGLAYSCMMVMATGFKQALSMEKDQVFGLKQLASGELGETMLPPAFNVGYVGPNGPMIYDSNGDLSIGNYIIYNVQNGDSVNIGHSLSGKMQLTQLPMFHDGTTKPPLDSPPSTALNPSYSSPVSMAILTISAFGILLCIVMFCIVVIFRKHEVFKASSPLFCCLELIGFILTYLSVIEMLDIPTQFTCYFSPITFTLGFLLVLGNMIAKNYRIYRIFNNVFITRNVITDWQLIKSTSMVVVVDMIILIVGLAVTQPKPNKVIVSTSTYFYECSTNSDVRLVFLIIPSAYGAVMLFVATFLAYKTRLADGRYNNYSECRQMGLSVYNILFSALVGYSAMVNPLADFYTRFYMGAISILWATTFSLLVLFVPKMYAFYRIQYGREKRSSPSSSRQQHSNTMEQHQQQSFLKPVAESDSSSSGDSTSLTSGSRRRQLKQQHEDDNDDLERHKHLQLIQEGEMPVRKVFRYFPYLAQWQMQRIMVFPWLGYVSHFTHSTTHGTVMAYSRTSVAVDEGSSHILKIHGHGWHDLYIQVANKETMMIWQDCFEPCDPPSSSDKMDTQDAAVPGTPPDDDGVILPDSSFSHDVLLLPVDHHATTTPHPHTQ
ncbi:unnamed protein product [Absidia cylindrospora]